MKITVDLLKPWRWFKSGVYCRNCEHSAFAYQNKRYCYGEYRYNECSKHKIKCKYFKQKK